jgi:hypothetical protein
VSHFEKKTTIIQPFAGGWQALSVLYGFKYRIKSSEFREFLRQQFGLRWYNLMDIPPLNTLLLK